MTEHETDASGRPAPYRIAPRPEWIRCDLEGHEGFAILAPRDVTNAERDELQRRHQAEVVEYELAYYKRPAAKRDPEDTPRRREQALVAPFVLDWNAVGLDGEGNEVPLPAPAAAGPEIFGALYVQLYQWIVRVVLMGYRATGKAGSWSAPSAPSPRPTPGGSGGDPS